jgi:hypothetical protein
MAMPKIGVKPEVMKVILSKMKFKKLMGVCFRSIFEQAGWCQALIRWQPLSLWSCLFYCSLGTIDNFSGYT